MNNQEAYDKMVTHLLMQGRQAIDANDQCRYRMVSRDNEGTAAVVLKCAVGCLIPDELYDEGMEDVLIRTLIADTVADGYDPTLADLFDGVDATLLTAAQRIHDRARVPDDIAKWPEKLAKLGVDFDLTLPAILKEALAGE